MFQLSKVAGVTFYDDVVVVVLKRKYNHDVLVFLFFFRILSHFYVGVDVSYETPPLHSVLRFLL